MKTDLFKNSHAAKDLAVLLGVAVLLFIFSATFDVFNTILSWLYRHDTWQLDEVFTVSLYMIFAFGIYAWRRQKELRVQIRRREEAEAEKALLIPEIASARTDIQRLRNLLPICYHCKRIRDDKGYWKDVEVYVEMELNTKLSEGLCPQCARELFGKKTG